MRTPGFVGDAERFAAAHGGAAAFRLLRLYLRCGDDELALTVKKLYCLSIPENTYGDPEPAWKSVLALAAMPFSWLLRKRVLWRPEEPRDFNLETSDPEHYKRHLAPLHDKLRGTKRLSPVSEAVAADGSAGTAANAAVRLGDALRLALLAPLMIPALWAVSRRAGVDLFQAYRRALSLYSVYGAYFKRYPCSDFVTIHDDMNHPCRHIAFRQLCRGRLSVIQNGERLQHPLFAFGSADRYFVFGEAYGRLMRSLGVRASFEPVGALYLNDRVSSLRREPGGGDGTRYDIMFVDQGFRGSSNLSDRSADSIVRILANLAAFKRAHPEKRIAYQLRPYTGDPGRRQSVVDAVARHCPAQIDILENTGQGESYRNALRANLVMTFESSFGFEAMMLGAKALFVNYSCDPAETICEDERFQLVDDAAGYAAFERKVLGLLALELDGVPEAARSRHLAMDGRVQDRIADALNAGRAG